MQIIGIDIGGTFTDVVALEVENQKITSAKTLTVRGDESSGVLACLSEIAVRQNAVERVVHGTTIGTNAILERRGAKTAILTTHGFRDLLEIGRTRRMAPNTLFDLSFRKPKPIVPRPLRFDVPERLNSAGEVLVALDDNVVVEVLQTLSEQNVEAVAVCFLHSYANAIHEARTASLVRERLPNAFISQSCEIVPEYREFERLTTTVLNASIGPLLDKYLSRLEDALQKETAGSKLYIMASSGGVMSVNRARQMPIQTVLSGPAGGVAAGINVARATGFNKLITCDMGGTSTDVCLVRSTRPRITVDNMIAGTPLKIPQVDMNTVGAGGGSIASVSADGELNVGPRSAGSSPGPICYGRGGTEVTVTDANLTLQRLAMDHPLGGKIEPSVAATSAALDALAQQVGISDRYQMAAGIIRIAVTKMVASIREISISRGYDPRECVLVAFGGAGPMHATAIAEELGIEKILIPQIPGNFSAWGLLSSDIRHDLAETVLLDLQQDNMEQVQMVISRLRQQAHERLSDEGFEDSVLEFEPSLDVRYKGQAFELSIPIGDEIADAGALLSEFHETYAQYYGHANKDQSAEIVNVRLVGLARTRIAEPEDATASGEALIHTRWVYFDGMVEDVPVYDRNLMKIGEELSGPLIVEETGATTVVAPSWNCIRDSRDTLLLTHVG